MRKYCSLYWKLLAEVLLEAAFEFAVEFLGSLVLRGIEKVFEATDGLWPVQDRLGIIHTGTHAFRHAAASELLEEGAPIRAEYD